MGEKIKKFLPFIILGVVVVFAIIVNWVLPNDKDEAPDENSSVQVEYAEENMLIGSQTNQNWAA